MYPVLKDNVGLGSFRFGDEEGYFICNAESETWVSKRLYVALMKADGTAPLDLPDNGHSVIPRLRKLGYIRTSRFEHEKGLICSFTILNLRSRALNNNCFLKLFSAVLPFLSVIVFVIGLLLMNWHTVNFRQHFDTMSWYMCIFISIVAHEAGHLAALAACGYEVYDTGLLFLGVLPIGAYVSHKDKESALRNDRLKVSLAGIEMNILTAGIFFILSAFGGTYAVMFRYLGLVNLILVLFNLLPAQGLDGEAALSAVFDVDSIYSIAKKNLFDRKLRRRLYRSGRKGNAYFLILFGVLLSKVAFIILSITSLVWLLI